MNAAEKSRNLIGNRQLNKAPRPMISRNQRKNHNRAQQKQSLRKEW